MDGKAKRKVFVGGGLKSVEWVEPKKKGVPKPEKKTAKKDKE